MIETTNVWWLDNDGIGKRAEVLACGTHQLKAMPGTPRGPNKD